MRFNIYQRFVVEIIRKDGRWVAFRMGEGSKVPVDDLVVPQDFEASQLLTFLEDVYHEYARPGKSIELLA